MNQKQILDIVSLALISLNTGIAGNKKQFVGMFCSEITDNPSLAEALYEHLCAIEIGMRIS